MLIAIDVIVNDEISLPRGENLNWRGGVHTKPSSDARQLWSAPDGTPDALGLCASFAPEWGAGGEGAVAVSWSGSAMAAIRCN